MTRQGLTERPRTSARTDRRRGTEPQERDGRAPRSEDPLAGGGLARLRRHPTALAVVGLCAAIGTLLAIAAGTGFAKVGHVLSGISPAWLALAAATQVVGVVAYAFSYRVLASVDAGRRIPFGSTLRLVAAGFGGFTVGGGFTLDYWAWKRSGHSGRRARVRVLGLGAVEYAVLAPAACVSAIVLLATGSRAMPSLLWPWALAVPAGFAAALWAASKRQRLTKDGKRRRLDEMLRAIEVLRKLFRPRVECPEASIGMAVYWGAEILSMWAALRAFGANLSAPALIVAYATGYAATRRTLPLGGAGTTEALMTYSLHWVGLDVTHALAAVIVYRFFNFGLPMLPALRARGQVEPLLRGEHPGTPKEALERLVA